MGLVPNLEFNIILSIYLSFLNAQITRHNERCQGY